MMLKIQAINWDKIYAYHISNQRLVLRIYKTGKQKKNTGKQITGSSKESINIIKYYQN